MAPALRGVALRLLLVWILLGAALFATASVASLRAAPAWLPPVAVVGFAVLVAMTTRAGLYLAAARQGMVTLSDAGAPHRLWRLAPVSALLGGLASAPVVIAIEALGGSLASRRPFMAGLLIGGTLAFALAAFCTRPALERPVRPRESSLLGWILVDTALPMAALAALLGVGVGLLRLSHLDAVPPSDLARHLALTLLAYTLLVGPAGALKVGRERLGCLVEAPLPQRSWPGPFFVGGPLVVATLAVGPRVFPFLSVEAVLVVKAAMGLVAGGGLCLLGALRAAKVAQPPHPRARRGREWKSESMIAGEAPAGRGASEHRNEHPGRM